MQTEEKRVQQTIIKWSGVAANRKNPRTISTQQRVDTLIQRYEGNTIDSFELLTGLSYIDRYYQVAKEIRSFS